MRGSYDEEYRIIRPDGAVRWVHDRAFPIRDAAGQVYRIAGIAEDVTAQRQDREDLLLLAAAIEHTGEGVIITDADGTILYVNPAFEKTTGYTRDAAIGQNPRLLKSGQQDPAFYREMWSTLLAGETWRGRWVNRRRDGELYTQDSVITPIRSGGGRITHMVAVFRDVSDSLRLEEQFRHAQKMEAIGRLAGGVAHDFNNLLTAIKGHAQFALHALDGADHAREDVEAIASEADRAHTLTRQLLAFSRQQVSEPRVLDVGDLLRGAERMLRRLIGENIELVISLGSKPGRILADPNQMEQVLVNLAINARDAMPEVGTLTLEARVIDAADHPARGGGDVDDNGGFVRLRVSDTGTGIDSRIIDRNFDPFFTTKPAGKGTGLGLSTVYGIVKQAGGHVFVESGPGAGSTFEIVLPHAAGEVAAPVPLDEPRREPTGDETLLVVEDDTRVRSLVRRALQLAGFRVIEAADGDQAIAAFQQENGAIDLLLTDVVMPRMGGRQLAARLRTTRPDLKVLFMSGYAENEMARHGILQPGADFIEKPFEPRELQRRVRQVLDRPARSPAADHATDPNA